MKKQIKRIISIFLIELIILLPLAIAQSTSLFVDASVPDYSNEQPIDIEGESEQLARINMYVNNGLPRTLNADDNGNFLFPNTALNEGANTIRFTAELQSETVENTYTTTVDTIPPKVTINEPPNIIGKERIIINGTVNEEVTISFYVTTGEEDVTPPPKVTNLENTSVDINLVELSWDDLNISDFQQYIVYRNNKPLGIGADSSYNDYSDILANSNQTYTYEVAAMDTNGNIGQRSDPITITTPSEGRTDLPEEDVAIYEGVGGAQKIITTDSTFAEDIEIGREDGFYKIKIEAVDIADNKWVYEKEILLDTEDPEIEIISPKGNAQIFENYADAVTIRGKTEPGSRVYLYVKRTPFTYFDDTVDVYGFPEEIHDLDEADLRADCRVNIQGRKECSTHSDYETIADAQGYFEFEDIDLTSMWAGAWRIEEYPTGESYYDFVEQEKLKDFMESDLFFVAVDAAGRKGTNQILYDIVTCWSTDLTWDVTPLIEYQSPTFLSVERIKEGTEWIYFYFNFTYHGKGIETKNTKITNLYVSNACGSGYLENQERYEYSCEILEKACTSKLSPKGKTAYVACQLGRLDGIEEWADGDWESFIDAVKDEMAFPFKIRVTYDEENYNKSVESRKTHQLCTEVSYVVDAAYINPKEILPDWLLYDAVDLLNTTIKNLNKWIEDIRQILEWTSIGCIATFLVKFVTQIYRRITCQWSGIFKKGSRIGADSNQQDECRECIEEHEEPEVLEKFKKNKEVQDIISNTCLEKCYPSCSSAWNSEESLYRTYRWTCDRVFGHSTPSKWTETKSDTELFQKLSEGKGCANDESVRGRPLRAVNCKDIEGKYRVSGTFGQDDKCLEITSHSGGKRTETLYEIDQHPYSIGENVYKISKLDTSAPSLTYDLVIKQNEDNYLAPMEQTCKQICEGELTGEEMQIGLQTAKGKVSLENKGNLKSEKIKGKEGEGNIMASGCITPNQCISYTSGEVKQLEIEGEDGYVDVKRATPMGYTSDCFSPQYVSGDPDRRIECCCINSKEGAIPDYFQPGDIENRDGEFDKQGYPNMKWSYRYYKMEKDGGYKDKKYNENRYMVERDYPACFGQNNWMYDGFSAAGDGNLLIIDPMKQHVAAFQCIAISQILNRLALITNILTALQNCLLTIRTTGKADAGVCKEVFTQYICSFVWKIITWIRDGCLPFGSGVNLAASENTVLEAVTVGTKGIWDSVEDSQKELASEYNNAQLNNLIGVGEEDIFRKVCLGAFGYDWEIDMDSLVDIAYHSPYATLVQAILPSREFLTFDPTNYQSKYEYRSSWLVNPGCDLDNYEVYLACVTRDDMYDNADINCAKQSDPYGKNCDCLDLTPEQAPAELFYYQSRGKIRQNELQNVDSTQIQDRIKTSPYRYDHLMFKLRVDRNYEKNEGDISKCFPTGHEDGIFYFPITDFTAREVAGCSTDITTGTFSCRQGASFFYEEGDAWFNEIIVGGSTTKNILKPEGATFYAGNNEPINALVKYSKDDRKQCLVTRLLGKDKYTVIRAPAPIELRKGELEGEEKTGAIYTPEDKDISGGGYGFDIQYLNEEGRQIQAVAKLGYTSIKKAGKTGGGPLTFIDDPNNGAGIRISRDSTDSYSYNGQTKKISNSYPTGSLEIELDDIGATITVNSVYQTTPGKYEFFVQYLGGVEEQATKEPRFYLHLDLRYPITPNGDCDEVSGVGYDVIVSNGISQQVDIPIYILPGAKNTNQCDTKYERRDELGEEDKCVCGGSSRENCPQENNPGNATDDFRYCYGECRKYPRCEFNLASNNPCVCNPNIRTTKFDCGGSSTNIDAEPEETRTGWYCYEKSGENKPTCSQQPPSGMPTGPQDTTPLQVTLHSPQNNVKYNIGDDITIYATIQDDMADGSEKYEIVINSNIELEGENQEKEKVWVILEKIKASDFEPNEDVFIFIQATDNSIASDPKIVVSDIVQIKIEAET